MEHTKPIKATEVGLLKVKCAHLEVTLAEERAMHILDNAKKERNRALQEAFDEVAPKGAKIDDYKLSLDTGVFNLVKKEEKTPEN
jgi:hypothetical protein